MVRKTAITLAAVAVVTVGSALSASAMHGDGGHGGGFGGGHFSGGYFGGFGHPGMAHPAMLNGHHFAFRDRDRFFFRDRFFRHRFAFVGMGFPYGYYDGCYARVWTQWGWRWRYVCY